MSDDPFSLNELKPDTQPSAKSLPFRIPESDLQQVLAAVNAINSRLDRSDKRVDEVRGWISKEVEGRKQARSQVAQVAPATGPNRGNQIVTDSATVRDSARVSDSAVPVVKATKRKLKSGSNMQAVQLVAILVLCCVVGWFLFERSRDPEDVAKSDAKQRAVATMRHLSEAMAEGLQTIADDLRAEKLNERAETGERLKEVIRRSLDSASEEPLKALDALQPWTADRAADRFEAAAQGYAESAGRLK